MPTLASKIFFGRGQGPFRPGLIWGPKAGGMMASLDRLARLPIAPVITGGSRLCLVHVEDVAARLVSALEDDAFSASITTLAYPAPFTMREIMAVRAKGQRPIFIPVPMARDMAGFRAGLSAILSAANLRSDSVIGLAYADPAPLFDSTAQTLRPFGA